MALTRRSGSRFTANIWPGFVDAMTALLLVLMFVLSIFMIVQSILRETVSSQEHELDDLAGQVAGLAEALGLEQQSTDRLETQVGLLSGQLDEAAALEEQQSALIASLRFERDTARDESAARAAQISSFEAQVAALLTQNTDLSAALEERDTALVETEGQLETARAAIADLEDANSREISEKEALELALAQARDEIDTGDEQARLAAARREAMEALLAELRAQAAERSLALDAANESLIAAEQAQSLQVAATQELRDRLKTAEDKLTAEETQRLADAAAAQALRERLKNSDAELTAMTLQLEAQRRQAEETLTLLAAERAAQAELKALNTANLSAREKEQLALAEARALLSEEQSRTAEAQLQIELLNQQTAALRQQLGSLQALLDDANSKDVEAQVQIDALGRNLNTALARVASEQKRLADERAKLAELEAAEVARLAAEALDLRSYRSEFFGRVREILGDREGVQIQGDRFVFSSEVLFPVGSATLGSGGRSQIARVAEVLREVSREIPAEINWILRVDGHTDKSPVGGSGVFADNWELSQARALSVVKYLVDFEGIPSNRLAATGFGEFQPVDPGDSPDALARNRRIELKFTEK